MRALLYYPTINMPTEVLFQGILYWDRIGSVTPPDHTELLTADMRRTEDAGVYQALRLSGDDLTTLAGRFDPTVRELMSTLPAEDWAAPAPDNPLAEYLYGPKVPARVLDDLQQRGVASASLHNGQVLLAPRVFLALLSAAAYAVADRMSPTPDENVLDPVWVPHTSHGDARRIARRRGGYGAATTVDEVGWQLEIGGLLPIPDPGTPVERVLAFRDKHEDERVRLAVAVQRLLNDLRTQYAHPRDVFQAASAEITAALRDLERAGKARRLFFVRRGLLAGIAISAPAAAVMLSAVEAGIVVGTGVVAATFLAEPRPLAPGTGLDYLHQVRHSLP